MRFHLFKWLRPKKSKPWSGPMRGIREGETRVDAPPPTASDEQWLDFAAVSAMFNIYALCEEAWREQALRAYLAKWPVPKVCAFGRCDGTGWIVATDPPPFRPEKDGPIPDFKMIVVPCPKCNVDERIPMSTSLKLMVRVVDGQRVIPPERARR